MRIWSYFYVNLWIINDKYYYIIIIIIIIIIIFIIIIITSGTGKSTII